MSDDFDDDLEELFGDVSLRPKTRHGVTLTGFNVENLKTAPLQSVRLRQEEAVKASDATVASPEIG